MYTFYATQAADIRELLQRHDLIGRRPYCAHMVYLSLDVNPTQIEQLHNYARAIDAITGEVVSFIVLFEQATSVAYERRTSSQWDRDMAHKDLRIYPTFRHEAIFDVDYHDYEFDTQVEQFGQRRGLPDTITIQSSPRWSVKFAEMIGLSTSFLPCVVVFPGSSVTVDEECRIVSMDNFADGFQILENALAALRASEDGMAFINAVSRVDELEAKAWIPRWRIQQAETAYINVRKAVGLKGEESLSVLSADEVWLDAVARNGEFLASARAVSSEWSAPLREVLLRLGTVDLPRSLEIVRSKLEAPLDEAKAPAIRARESKRLRRALVKSGVQITGDESLERLQELASERIVTNRADVAALIQAVTSTYERKLREERSHQHDVTKAYAEAKLDLDRTLVPNFMKHIDAAIDVADATTRTGERKTSLGEIPSVLKWLFIDEGVVGA